MLFAKEIFPSSTVHADEVNLPLFCRVDITQRKDIDTFLSLNYENKTPVLFFPSLGAHSTRMDASFIDEITRRHRETAEIFMSESYRVMIAADNDGALHKLISPRNRPLDVHERAQPLVDIYQALAQISSDVGVFLTVEDLSPGGLDATDGIAIAQELAKCGLKEIVAAAGTRNFPPLFDRRITQKKRADLDDFSSREPALASALWLRDHTDLGVYAYAFVDNRETALDLASRLGLQGIIQRASS